MPCIDVCPGPSSPRDFISAADAGIVVAVLAGIADAHDAAVGKAQATRALDFEEEQVDRVRGPADFQPLPVERAVLDLRTIPIGHELPRLIVSSAPRLALARARGGIRRANLYGGGDHSR